MGIKDKSLYVGLINKPQRRIGLEISAHEINNA